MDTKSHRGFPHASGGWTIEDSVFVLVSVPALAEILSLKELGDNQFLYYVHFIDCEWGRLSSSYMIVSFREWIGSEAVARSTVYTVTMPVLLQSLVNMDTFVPH